MPCPVQEPTREPAGRHHDSDDIRETHPAFGRVVLHRVSSTPGASLFDSEIRHQHYVVLSVHQADRTRSLHRDWIHPDSDPLVEIAMSEAQWAAMVSSFNDGGGTSCTIQATQNDRQVPSIPFDPRLALSTAETVNAARRVADRIQAALAAVEDKPTKANVRALRSAVDSVESNVKFAAESLTRHVENTVEKARADIEAMVDNRARQVGLPVEHRPVIDGSFADDPPALD